MPYQLIVPKDAESLVNQNPGGVYDLWGGLTQKSEPENIPVLPKTPESWFGELGSAFGRGVDELQQMGYGAGALTSSWLGADGAKDWFLKGYNANTQQIQQNPETVKSLGDVKDFDTAVRYGLAATGEFLPLVAQSLITGSIGSAAGTAAEPGVGTIGGGLTGFVARKAVSELLQDKVKQVIGEGVAKELGGYLTGGVAKEALSKEAQLVLTRQGTSVAKRYGADAAVGFANVGIMQGALYGDMANNPDIPESDKRTAATIGGLLAAIPMTSVSHLIAKSFISDAATDMVGKTLEQDTAEKAGYLSRFLITGGKELMKSFGEGGAAMFTQSAINIAAKNWADPNTRWNFLHFSPEQWQDMIDSAAKGAVGIGLFSGAVGTISKMTSYPDPRVRSDMRDVLTKADDVKIVMPEVTPEHQELEKVQTRIGELESVINDSTQSAEDKGAAQAELVTNQQREQELTSKLFPPEEQPLVNQSAETAPKAEESKPVPEPKTEPKEPSPLPPPSPSKIDDLRAFYAQRMPTEASGEPVKVDPTAIADKQAENEAHIDQVAGDTEYGKQLKAALTPNITALMAAENVHLATDTKGEKGYAATIANDGKIRLYVPASSNPAEVGDSILHELGHVADLSDLREEFQGRPEPLTDLVNQRWEERGKRLREAEPTLPAIAKQAYQRQVGELSDVQLGQEIPRMAMEMARRGQTTEVTAALQQAAQSDGKINVFFQDWINSLKNIGQVIKRFLDPASAHPDLLKAYNDINATLDKYGVGKVEAPRSEPLVNQKPPEPSVPEVKAPVEPAKPKEPTLKQVAHQNFREAIKTAGPSDAVRSYLDWQKARGEMPISNAEIRAAHQDFQKRAPNHPMTRERFQQLVKEKNREQASESQPAKKEAIANPFEVPGPGHDRDIQSDTTGARGYNSRIIKDAAQAAQNAKPGQRLSAIREHLSQHAPELLPHLENIQKEIESGKMDYEALTRLQMQPQPLRGVETADALKTTENTLYVNQPITDLTRELLKDRGIGAVGKGEEPPADTYFIDTSGIFEGHDLVNQSASVRWPVEITNKLDEAGVTDGIPETHALSELDIHTLTPESVAKLDKQFGHNGWIIKSFSDDAVQGKSVYFPEVIKRALQGNPDLFEQYDHSELMVQKLHDVPDFDRSHNQKIQSGQELRVHVLTDETGQPHILPYTTFVKLTTEEAKRIAYEERTPLIVEDASIRMAHEQALRSIASLPEADRTGQFYGLDMVKLKDGTWGTIENNPTAHNGESGFFALSPLAHDAYVAALMGEHPVHAELARLVHDNSRESLVNQRTESIPAEKPDFSKKASEAYDKALTETNKQFDRDFNYFTLEHPKSTVEERGGAGEYQRMTPQAMEYQSQPQTEAMIRAQRIISEHGLDSVIETLEREPFGERYQLHGDDEILGGLNAGVQALYNNVMAQIESALQSGELDGHRAVVNHLEEKFRTLETLSRTLGTQAGRAASMTNKVNKVWNAAQGRRTLVDPLINHLTKVLGKPGMRFIEQISEVTSQMLRDYASRVTGSSGVIAQLQKIYEASRTRAFQQEARKTYVKTDKQARRIVKNMAARMATYKSLDEMSAEKMDLVAKAITKNMNQLPRGAEKKTEVQLFTETIRQVARDNAEELGMLGEKGKAATMEDKFASILKNDGLYYEFTSALMRRMRDEYKPEPGTEYAAQFDKFHQYMQERMWSQGMVDTLVNQNIHEYETTFSKIAKDHYSRTNFQVDAFKQSIREAMAERGVENEGLLNQLVDDAEGAMRSKIEQGRLNFFGSPGAIKDVLKNMQTSLTEKAKEHPMSKSGVPEAFSSWLADDFGIPDTKDMPLASTLQEVMVRQYNEMLKEKRAALVQDMVDRATKDAPEAVRTKSKQSVDDILKLINLGVFRDEDAYKALAPKLGLPAFDSEAAKQAESLGEKIATAPNEASRDEAKGVLSMLMASQKGVRPYDMFTAGIYTNWLSGPSTFGTHVSGNGASFMGLLAVNAVQFRKNIPAMLRTVLRSATGSAQIDARESFFTGMRLYRAGDKFFDDHNPLEMKNPVFKSNVDYGNDKLNGYARASGEALARFSHKVYTGLGGKYIGRYLNAADAFFYKLAQEASFSARTGYVETAEMRGSAMDQARKEMAQEGLKPEDSRAMRRKQQVYANRILDDWRIQNEDGTLNEDLRDHWQSAHNEAMDTTFKQEPKGLLGEFSKLIERWATGRNGNINPIGKMLIPFTRIAANVTNQMLEWTPYGLVRFAGLEPYGEAFKLKDKDGNLVRDPKIAIRAFLGTMGGIGLATMFGQHADDNDPYLAVYGEGPSNPEARRQLMARGWRPHTVKVGKLYTSYVTIPPLAMTLSILGRMFDDYRDGKIRSVGDASLATAGVAMLKSVTHESFLSSLTDFMSAVDSPDPTKKIEIMMSRMTIAPLVPNLVQQVDKWLDPSVQQAQGYTESVIKYFPIVRHQLKPSLNFFGEPILHDPAIDLPGVERFLTMEKTDDPVYNFLGESRVVVPGFSKSSRLGNQIMTREQYYDYVRLAGPKIKQAIQAELPQLRSLDRERQQEKINEIARKIKEQTRNQMRGS